MTCNSCKGRGWHTDLKTRQAIPCPVCNGVPVVPSPQSPSMVNGHFDYALYDTLELIVSESRPASYLEIGVRDGMSLECVLNSDRLHRISQLCLCDSWGVAYGGDGRGNHLHISALLERRDYKGHVEFCDGDSKIMIPRIKDKFDLILVDGDHSHSGCLTDMVNAWSRLKDGGFMVIDDIIHTQHLYLADTVKEFVSANHDTAKIHFWNEHKYSGVAVIYKIKQAKRIVSRSQEDL